jgi:hypothetical protein
MVTCKEAMLNLSAYLTKKLPTDLEDEISSHLWHCELCPRVSKMNDVWVLQEPPLRVRKPTPLRIVPNPQPQAKLAPRRPAKKSA